MKLIELKSISKNYLLYKNNVYPALTQVSLDIGKNEFVALIGPSGSGKTTLFNILGCIDKPSSGEYLFEGQEISIFNESQLVDFRRNKIGYIFQLFNLIPTLTNFENAEMVFWNDSQTQKKLKRERLLHLFHELGIYDFRNRYPSKISGGQKQRVAIARALANQPQVILADEPTGNLDSKTTEQIIKTLKQEMVENHTTFIIATHDTSILSEFKKIISLRDGEIIDNV